MCELDRCSSCTCNGGTRSTNPAIGLKMPLQRPHGVRDTVRKVAPRQRSRSSSGLWPHDRFARRKSISDRWNRTKRYSSQGQSRCPPR